jgi:putative DNA primase/helicase
MPLVSGSLEHALEVAKFGFAVFPLRQKQQSRGSHGFKHAVRDPEAIRALWGRYRGGDGVGIATGEVSGMWGLDVDVKDGRDGNKTLADLERQRGLFAAHTPSENSYWRAPLLLRV